MLFRSLVEFLFKPLFWGLKSQKQSLRFGPMYVSDTYIKGTVHPTSNNIFENSQRLSLGGICDKLITFFSLLGTVIRVFNHSTASNTTMVLKSTPSTSATTVTTNTTTTTTPSSRSDSRTEGDVLLITGGLTDGDERLSSAEIFDPSNPSLVCNLPAMTVAREAHASVGGLVCGGSGGAEKSCENIDNGQWKVSHSLQQYRAAHVMWQTPSQEILVMGGSRRDNWDTTESLQQSGDGWTLLHDTAYI